MQQPADQKEQVARLPGRSLFAAWRAVMSVTVLGSITGFLVSTLAARSLGASGYGVFAISNNTLTILIAVATVGYPMAILRFGPALLAAGDKVRFRKLIGSARCRTLSASGGLLLLSCVVLWAFPRLAPNGRVDVLLVMLAALPAAIWVQLHTSANRAFGHLELALLPDAIIKHLFMIGVGLLLVTGLWHGKPDPIAFAFAFLTGTAVSGILVYIVYRNSGGRISGPPESDPIIPVIDPKWFVSALGFFSHYIIGVLRSNTDILILAAVSSTKEAGIYAISLKLSEILSSIAGTLNYALSPRISAAFATGDLTGMEKDMRVAAWILAIFAFSVSLPLIIWAPTWLSFFGADFVTGAWALRLAVIAGMMPCLAGPTYQVLSMSGNEWLVARIEASATVVQLIALALLVGPFGAVGAALARCVALLVSVGGAWVSIRKRLGFTLGLWCLIPSRFRNTLGNG